ncbi:ABC transporter ATP-binding protein [Proteinivorax tanatarense]|uniref:ABC transporter ATP-binding protein n=1 Tax=Proteinivorax tanatarense TaxID=1260629 RepID=A0AAU7VRL4_9FIRM
MCFFKTVSGLLKPTEGKVICNGKEVGKEIDHLEDLGYMDNDAAFIKELTGFDNLKLLASIKKIGQKEIKHSMIHLGLDPDSKVKVKNYSLGMYQKLAISQAVMEDPSILIFDEPFNGLDKKSCKIVKDLIIEQREKGKVVMITSHILNDIEEVADKAYEFEGKRIIPLDS